MVSGVWYPNRQVASLSACLPGEKSDEQAQTEFLRPYVPDSGFINYRNLRELAKTSRYRLVFPRLRKSRKTMAIHQV